MSINNIQISLPQNEDIQHNAIKNRSVYLNICLHPFKYSHLRQDQTRTTLGKLLECMLMKTSNSFYSGNKFFFIKIKTKVCLLTSENYQKYEPFQVCMSLGFIQFKRNFNMISLKYLYLSM